MTNDLDADAKRWASALELVLSDREAAFARAVRLRQALAGSLSWERETTVTEILRRLGV